MGEAAIIMSNIAITVSVLAIIVNILVSRAMYRTPYMFRLRKVLYIRYRMRNESNPSVASMMYSFKKLTPKNWIK